VDQLGLFGRAVDYSGPPEPGPGAEALLRVVRECRPGRPVVVKVRAAANAIRHFIQISFWQCLLVKH
jgi:hypothetical protein